MMKRWMRDAVAAVEEERRVNSGEMHARTRMERCIIECLNCTDHFRAELLSAEIALKFQSLGTTRDDVVSFVERFPPHSALQAWYRTVLSYLLTNTSANAFLGLYVLQVLNERQSDELLCGLPGPPIQFDTLLDVGAGVGEASATLAQRFRTVVSTEMSLPCVWRLQQRGDYSLNITDLSLLESSAPPCSPLAALDCIWRSIPCLGARHWQRNSVSEGFAIPRYFDVITCFNLLDRCSQPRDMLRKLRERLHPEHGRLIIALVLPFRPCVETGVRAKVSAPHEHLPVAGATWEEAVNSFVWNVLEPCSLHLDRLCRVPYLCQGDIGGPFFALDDAIFVVRRSPHEKYTSW